MDAVNLLEEYVQKIGKPWKQWGSQETQGFYEFKKREVRTMNTEERSESGVRSSEEMLKEHIIESKAQLAETIAKMAEGVMRIQGIILPRKDRVAFEMKVQEFIAGCPDVMQQIENLLRSAMTRPPAA